MRAGRWTALALALLLATFSACAGGGEEGAPPAQPVEDSALQADAADTAAVDALSGASEEMQAAGTQQDASPPDAAGGDSVQPVVRDGEASGIYTRTTARSFSAEALSEEQIDQLIRAAFTSPTGGGQRSWELIVVTDREVMQGIQAGHPNAGALDSAPLVIVVAADENAARFPELLEFDAGIATQSILIQAAELGLATVAMSITPQEERVRAATDALGLPDGVTPQIMVAVGYPATDAVSSASVDYYNSDKVHYNGY